jgi:hypothetical protein
MKFTSLFSRSSVAAIDRRTLRIDLSDGECWVFPWRRFVHARYGNSADGEEMMLRFGQHEVIARGHRLVSVRRKVAKLRLATLRIHSQPTLFKSLGADISSIEVRPLQGEVNRRDPDAIL